MSKTFEILVKANSRAQEIIKLENNKLKIKLNASPVKGAANKELIRLLAKYFDVAPSRIEIIKGLTAKTKLVRIY